MDFFAAQEQSRQRTRLLVAAYLLATLAVAAAVTAIFALVWLWSGLSPIAPDTRWLEARWTNLAFIALGTLAFIGLASLSRILSLRGGGARVARELGGTPVSADTADPLRRRLRNVVEEMSIAAGLPVPDIYVLEQEAGINAFAAGYRPEDAVVAVTRGALEQLDRDELQGVIGHEFSHILNGDMRLNIRMMGPLFGIMALGFIGRTVLRNARFSRGLSGGRSGSRGGGGLVLLVAAGLMVIGYVGVLCARLIKAAVSRQREYLADASAVQFTRLPSGLAGALKKIGGLDEHSYLRRADGEEVSHMLFAEGGTVLRLFATHPPLTDRIRRLDPAFTGLPAAQSPSRNIDAAANSPLASFALAPAQVAEQAGRPEPSHVAAAHVLHRSIPATIYAAAHGIEESLLLAVALVLHADPDLRNAQLSYVGRQLGPARAADVARLQAAVSELGPQYRLPLLDLAFPALKHRPDSQLEYLRKLIHELVYADGQVELFEYCLAKLLDASLGHSLLPGQRPNAAGSASSLQDALLTAFATLARYGHESGEAARAAFAAGLAHFDPQFVPASGLPEAESDWPAKLDAAFGRLMRLHADERRRLIAALALTASHDGRITVAESELLRVFCAVLDCPLPPLYANPQS